MPTTSVVWVLIVLWGDARTTEVPRVYAAQHECQKALEAAVSHAAARPDVALCYSTPVLK